MNPINLNRPMAREDATKKEAKPKVIRKGNIITISHKDKGLTFWNGLWIFWKIA